MINEKNPGSQSINKRQIFTFWYLKSKSPSYLHNLIEKNDIKTEIKSYFFAFNYIIKGINNHHRTKRKYTIYADNRNHLACRNIFLLPSVKPTETILERYFIWPTDGNQRWLIRQFKHSQHTVGKESMNASKQKKEADLFFDFQISEKKKTDALKAFWISRKTYARSWKKIDALKTFSNSRKIIIVLFLINLTQFEKAGSTVKFISLRKLNSIIETKWITFFVAFTFLLIDSGVCLLFTKGKEKKQKKKIIAN